LKDLIEQRAVELGEFIIDNEATVRACAKKFGISKSTVHKDVTQRLERVNYKLYEEVKRVLDKNKAERHLRGGIATRNKYQKQQRNSNQTS